MTRQEALQRFHEEETEFLEEKKLQFYKGMQQQTEELSGVLRDAFKALKEEVKRLEKEKIMFFHFSLLRVDLLLEEYRFFVQAFDARWYMDTEPAETTFTLKFLFSMLEDVKKKLTLDAGKYMGKVNRYDISEILQNNAMEWNQILAGELRFLLRDIEENKDFSDIPKLDTWGIYWGEYRDASELVAFVDREKKYQKDWERALRLSRDQEEALISKYWYDMEIRDSDGSGTYFLFNEFENCTLTQIAFDNTNFSGSRFRNCTIKGCSFQNAVIRQADFENCKWEDNDFSGADLTNSIFFEEDIPFLHMEPEQLQTILIDRRAKG
ncbi:pentapeptide repeat-containing protein [Lacrimispora sp.]|uniref:pentapeptide repeat-containing protein n=1 Tax=Lacrimispora sp. TaxID=2719234 RepID=UPI003995EA6E